MEERSEQKLIFYISKTLLDAESRYPLMEKLAYAVVTSARKLRLYFQSHTIVILTTFPLLTILHSPIQSGRLAKWAVELSEYDIEYRPRTSSKSQVLADFLVELPPGTVTNKEPNSTWFLHVDGSSSKQGSCIGIRLTSPTSEILEQSFRLGFHASNNEAEYETLIAELRLAHGLKIRNIHAYCDSQLVASQYSVKYEARDERMDAYLKLVQNLAQEFDCFSLTRIPRSENFQADALAALASSSDPGLERVIPVEFIEHPSIEPPIVINLIRDQDDDVDEVARQPDERSEQSDYGYDTPWLETIRAYITDGKLPPKKWAAGKIRTQAARYVTVNGEIYKWKLSGPLMTCLEGEMVRNVMEEVHSGSCGNHSGGRSLAVKMKRHRYYGPTMIGDCKKFARKCEKSQRHAPTIRQPAEVLSSITSPYPFMRWAMDIVGPLQNSKKKRFLLVLTDFFSKWVEADSYASIKDVQVENFVSKNIICRHGVPYEIVTNNGSQFISTRFEAFCEKRKIRLNKSTPRYIHNAMAKPRQSIRPF
ncbi:hypothetical protein YC2023_098911 [Brassica napus]